MTTEKHWSHKSNEKEPGNPLSRVSSCPHISRPEQGEFWCANARVVVCELLAIIDQQEEREEAAFKAGQEWADPTPFTGPNGNTYQVTGHRWGSFSEYKAHLAGEPPPELHPYTPDLERERRAFEAAREGVWNLHGGLDYWNYDTFERYLAAREKRGR